MKVRRRIYLIEPKFQLKFCFFVTSLVFIGSLFYPFTIYSIIQNITDSVGDQTIKDNFMANESKIIFILCSWQLALTFLVFIVSIFQSHKIAGPVYKMKKFLSEIKQGNVPGHLFFRKGDNFKDLADDFNEAFQVINEQHSADVAYIEEVGKFLENLKPDLSKDKQDIVDEINHKISDIQRRYQNI